MYKDLIKSIFIYGIGISISRLVNIFLMPIYTRTFSSEQYGIIDLTQTIVIIASIIGMLQLNSAIQRFYFELKDTRKQNEYISTALITIVGISGLLMVLLWFTSQGLSLLLFKDGRYGYLFLIAGFLIPITNLHLFLAIILRYMKKHSLFVIFSVIQLLLSVASSIWLVVILKFSIMGVFLGQIIGYIGSLTGMLLYLRKRIIFFWNIEIIKKMFHFSLPMVPANVGSLLNTYFNRFVMVSILTISDIGIFTIAVKIASMFQLLTLAFRNAWYPLFYEYLKKDNHKQIFINLSRIIAIITFVVIIIFSFFSEDIIKILTTKEFFQAIPLIKILILAFGLELVIIPMNVGHIITKKTIYASYIYFIGACTNIISLFILVPGIGIIGVPISLVLSNVILMILQWIISEKLYFIGFKKLYFIACFLCTAGLVLLSLIVIIPFLLKIGIFLMFVLISFLIVRKKTLLNKFLKI